MRGEGGGRRDSRALRRFCFFVFRAPPLLFLRASRSAGTGPPPGSPRPSPTLRQVPVLRRLRTSCWAAHCSARRSLSSADSPQPNSARAGAVARAPRAGRAEGAAVRRDAAGVRGVRASMVVVVRACVCVQLQPTSEANKKRGSSAPTRPPTPALPFFVSSLKTTGNVCLRPVLPFRPARRPPGEFATRKQDTSGRVRAEFAACARAWPCSRHAVPNPLAQPPLRPSLTTPTPHNTQAARPPNPARRAGLLAPIRAAVEVAAPAATGKVSQKMGNKKRRIRVGVRALASRPPVGPARGPTRPPGSVTCVVYIIGQPWAG